MFCPGHSASKWARYSHNCDQYAPNIRPHAPAANSKRLGRFQPVTIGNLNVLCMKSELHLNQDGVKTGEGTAPLPGKDFFKQVITESHGACIFTVGTSGSVFDDFQLGDVVVTRTAKFRLQQEFRNEPFNGQIVDIEVNKKTDETVAKHLYLAHKPGGHDQPRAGCEPGVGWRDYEPLPGALRGGDVHERARDEHRLDVVSDPPVRGEPVSYRRIVYPGGYLTTTPGAVRESLAVGNVAAVAQRWASSGAGEAGSVPPAPAVANAFFDATGVRIREAPMTPDGVRSELEAAGASSLERGLRELVPQPTGWDRESSRSAALVAAGR